MKPLEKNKRNILLILTVSLIVVALISAYLGKFPMLFSDYLETIGAKVFPNHFMNHPEISTILFKIRWPRIIMALLIGAGLAVSGSTYQALFQNPMLSQDILGASQGAAFGAALGLFLNTSYEIVVLFSFIGGIVAVSLVLGLNRLIKSNGRLNMILIGMMIGSLFSSAISFLKLIGDPTNTLPAITYWLMGSLSSIKMQDVYYAGPLIIIGMLPIIILRWQLNVFSLGEIEAQSLGINVKFLRLVFIASATLITATAVSISGQIGWVGLVVPHFARLLLGANYRYTIPATALIGGSFLLIVDDFARLLTTSEIPIGILTSVIGAPIFILLIAKSSHKLEG